MLVRLETTIVISIMCILGTTLFHQHYDDIHHQKNNVVAVGDKKKPVHSLGRYLQEEGEDKTKISKASTSGTGTKEIPEAYTKKNLLYYDDKDSWVRKTESFMPYLPALDGYMHTHGTYRFLSVREQVASLIGEAKHGLWRLQDSGMVRLYRKKGPGLGEFSEGVPVGADVYDASLQRRIKKDYKAVLKPWRETGDVVGWGGYRFKQNADGDGQAAFVDVPIYHDYFEGKYDDHPVIDLPQFICSMSQPLFDDAADVWNFAKKQPNANKIGPLGIRAGLDITELYSDVIKFDMYPDARMWIQIGMSDEDRNIFDQTDIDDGTMSMDVAYRALDTSKVDFEVYLLEKTFSNVPYLNVVVVVDNHDNDHLSYVRPHGLYWDKLVEKGLTSGLKTTVTYDPEIPIIEQNGSQATKTMRYTPLSAMNILDGYGYGNWCPQKGGDYARWPRNPSGSGAPNQYEEVTPVCDAFVVDIKMFANLDIPSWDSSAFQLQNAGTAQLTQTYIGGGNQYGDYTDPWLVDNGMTNPHALHFTETNNPNPRPTQGIEVTFDQIGVASKWIHPVNGNRVPRAPGLTKAEKKERRQRKALITNPGS